MRLVALVALVSLSACEAPAPAFVEVDLPGDTRDPTGPYRVTAVVRGPVDRVEAEWVVSDARGGEFELGRADDRWAGDIPGQPAGSRITVTLVATGPGGVVRSADTTFAIRDRDGRCLVDGDCLGTEICADSRCRAAPDVCLDDSDCGQDLYCAEPGQPCHFRPTVCGEDADCAPGYACVDGVCGVRPECLDDRDCPDGRCIVPPGRCADADVCFADVDCPADRPLCRDNRCRADEPVVPCPGGCPAGTRCLGTEARCVGCTADGHCPGGHCDIGPYECAPMPRGLPCIPCGPSTPCGGGHGCPAEVGGVCLPRCAAGCPAESVCINGVCEPDEPAFCSGSACRLDGDCDSRVCNAGWCEPRQYCVLDADCAGDRRCVDARCVPSTPLCARAGDCPRGQICLGGRCAPGAPVDPCRPCTFAADCGSPALCVPFADGERRCAALCGGDDCPGGELGCVNIDQGFSVCLDAENACPRPGCGGDDFEPNDGPDNAPPVGLGGVINGRMCSQDEDWFALIAPGGSTLSVQTEGNLVATVFADGDVAQEVAVPAGGGVELGLPGGADRLRVTSAVAADFGWRMALIAPDCAPDGFEPDDSPDDATVLGGGADVRARACVDEDWYRIRSRRRAGSVQVASLGQGAIDARLLDEGNGVIVADRGAGELDLRFPQDLDVVFLVVRCVDCDGGVPYGVTTRLAD